MLFITLLQLALTQIVAGLYGAVVVRSLIYFFYFTLSLISRARQAEEAKTFAAAESRSKPAVYVSHSVIYRLWTWVLFTLIQVLFIVAVVTDIIIVITMTTLVSYFY